MSASIAGRRMSRESAEEAIRAVASAPDTQVAAHVRDRAATAEARLEGLSDNELAILLSWLASRDLSEISSFLRVLVGGLGRAGGMFVPPTVVQVGPGEAA